MAYKPKPKVTKKHEGLALKDDCTALYIRVSTEKQAEEGYSLDAQRDKLMSFCNAHGWTVCAEHVYKDEGISGKTIEARQQFRAMLQAAQDGHIVRVVVTKLDRIARNLKDLLDIVDTLKACSCDLVIIDQHFDTSTPNGVFFMQMMGAIAQLEASMIADRMMTGKTQKASEGGYNGAYCPLGYAYDKKQKEFTINDDADTVRFIFHRWLVGDSMRSIAEQLNTAGKTTRRGGRWAQATVRYILLNGFYAGLAQWDGVQEPGNHPAIIDRSTYDAAIARVEAAKRGNPNFRVNTVTR